MEKEEIQSIERELFQISIMVDVILKSEEEEIDIDYILKAIYKMEEVYYFSKKFGISQKKFGEISRKFVDPDDLREVKSIYEKMLSEL